MKIAILGIIALITLIGCTTPVQQTTNVDGHSTVNDSMMDDHMKDDMAMNDHAMDEIMHNDTMENDDSMMDDGKTMMKKGVTYTPFTQEAYDQAKAGGKTIFLEFYANWCPVCQAQEPALIEGFSSVGSNGIVAFRVNYKDGETDASEQALAQKFNITYQHTHVVTNASEETLLKSQEQWSATDVVEKVGVFA